MKGEILGHVHKMELSKLCTTRLTGRVDKQLPGLVVVKLHKNRAICKLMVRIEIAVVSLVGSRQRRRRGLSTSTSFS